MTDDQSNANVKGAHADLLHLFGTQVEMLPVRDLHHKIHPGCPIEHTAGLMVKCTRILRKAENARALPAPDAVPKA